MQNKIIKNDKKKKKKYSNLFSNLRFSPSWKKIKWTIKRKFGREISMTLPSNLYFWTKTTTIFFKNTNKFFTFFLKNYLFIHHEIDTKSSKINQIIPKDLTLTNANPFGYYSIKQQIKYQKYEKAINFKD